MSKQAINLTYNGRGNKLYTIDDLRARAAQIEAEHEQHLQQKAQQEAIAKAQSDYKYATTPIIPTVDPTLRKLKGQNANTLQFNPIAVEGTPVNPDSGIRLVSQEVYDAAMKERERQEQLQRSKNSPDLSKWTGTDTKKTKVDDSTEVPEFLKDNLIKDSALEYAKYKEESTEGVFPTVDNIGDMLVKSRNQMYENSAREIDGKVFYNDYSAKLYLDSKKRYAIEAGVRMQPNFTELVAKTAATVADEDFKKHVGADIKRHNVINGHEDVSVTSPYFKYTLLEDNEKATYNYLSSFTNPKAVTEYLYLIDQDLEQRKAQAISENLNQLPGPLSTGAETLAVAASGLASGLESIGNAGLRMEGGYSKLHTKAYAPSQTKLLSSAIIENEDNAILKAVYETISTVANQAPALAYGLATGSVGYAAVLGTQVTSDSMAEAAQNNKPIESGFVYGLAQTALELSLEKLFGGIASKIGGGTSGGFVRKMMNAIDSKIGNKVFAKFMKSGLSLAETGAGEFVQEFTQAMLDPMLRNVIYKENNTYSEKTLLNALYQGVIGFFAGGVMAVPSVKTSIANTQYEQIGEKSNAKDLLSLCEEIGCTDSENYTQVKKAVEKSKQADAIALGRLSVEATQTIYDNTHFTEEYLTAVANTGTVEEISELMFGGNTEAAVKFKEKYSSQSVVDEGQSQGYNENNVSLYENDVFSYENNDGGNVSEETSTDPQERGQGGDTRERTGLLQSDLGGNDDQGRATRIEQGKSSSIRSSEGGRDRSITPEQSERLKNTAIKNDDGTPKAVYHFTDNMEFDVFAKGDIGFHFGNETQAAARGSILNKNGRTITAYLDIKSPLIIPSDIMCWRPRNLAFRLFCDGIISERDFDTISELDNTETYEYDAPAAVKLRRILSEKGYDGIVYQNMFEGDGESYIAFYPEQVIIINDGRGDTDTTAAPGENSDSPSLSDSAPTGITELSAADKKKDVFQRAAEDVLGYKELSEEQKTIRDIGRQLGWKVVFAPVRTPKGSKADGKISFATKTITIDPTSKKPIQFILKHELAHSLEQNKEAYTELQNAIMDSQAFKDYVKAQGFASTSAYNANIVARYKAEGVEDFDNARAEYKANCEMVANFVGDCLFGGNTEVTARLLEGINNTQRRSFIQWVQDFFAKLRNKLSGKHKQLSEEISKLENEFLNLLNSVEQKENTATKDDESDAYSINKDFYSDFDAWDGKDTNKVFTLGTTSEALKSVNIKNQEIKMRSGMILQKLSKHPEMSREIFRSIPDLLEKPIIVQFSDAIDPKTGKPKYDSRITVLGELYADMVVDGKTVQKPVLVSLELLPTNQKKTKILDISFVTSAYTKDALQQYINENSILYIEPNKKRTNKWLSLNRLSLPLGENRTGPIRKITYTDGKVKVQNSTKKTEMQLALEKAGVINSYGNSIFNDSDNDTSDNESFSISTPSRVEDVLERFKNEEISVEEADKLLYNKSSDNSDTHYGEHIHHTPSDYKPASDREWQVFCRSFANQTNGMKDGEYRAVSIFTADAHYLISADGYMSGVIVDKVSIDEYEERKEFYDNITRADVSNFRNEENGSGQRNHSNSDIASQNEEADSFDVELDAFIESHPEWFANKRKTRSNYSRSIKKSAETDESFSISEKTDIDSVLEGVSRGEISTQEAKALLSRRKTLNPAEIANMKEEDANTTPKLKRRQGENKGDRDSKFYKSLMGSSIFDDTFKQEAADDSFIQRYKSVTNAETLKKAAEALDEGGEEYVKRWDNIKPEESSLIDAAVGFILMDRYQRVGDYQSAIKVAERVKAFGTTGGQKIQLYSILSRLDPNTMVIYAQRELTSAFEILQKKRTQKWIDENARRFNLNEEEIEFIRRRTLQAAQLPEGRDKARLLAEISALLQDKLPPERGQGLKALQRISMLLTPRTNERNILGNAGWVPVFITSDFFGSGIDRIVSKQTGTRTTGMFDPKSVKGFAKGAFETMDDFRRHINTRNEELNRFETGKINKSGKAFNEQHTGRLAKQLNDCAKVLNALDRFTSFCLELGDRPFYEMWYVNSINNQLKLNKTNEATPEMIQIACLEALQRTWQDTNKLVKVVTNAKGALNVLNIGGYGLGDVMIKFVKTPANLTKAIVDFSPAGVVKAIAVDAKNLRNAIEKGQFEASLQKKFVDSLSKGIAGSMLYVLAAALASAGMLSGAGDDDKDVSNFEKYIQGIPEYSIKLFGKWWSYDWMQPIGAVFATVADYMKTREENPDSTMYEDIIEAIRAGGEVLYNQSFMQSIQMLFTADNPIDGFFEAILNDPSVFVPQFVSQIASVTDDYRRVTYEAGKPFETAMNKVKLKIPGLRQTLEKQVDVLGRDVPNSQNNVFNAFFNPGNTYTDTSNAVTDEVYALFKRTGELSVIPRKAPYSITKAGITRQLTAEQTNDYQRLAGNTSAELLEVIFDSTDYVELDDVQKVDLVTKVYDYAAKYAKAQLDIYDYELLSAIEGADKNGDPILSEDLYNRLDEKAKQILIDEAFYSKAELKCKGDTEKLVKLFLKQVKE